MKTPFSPFGRLYKNYSVPNIRRLEVVICLGQMIQECLYSQELSYFLDINQQDITTSLHVMPNWCTFLILLQDVMSREQLIIHSIRTGGAAPVLFRPTVTRLKLITSVERTWLHGIPSLQLNAHSKVITNLTIDYAEWYDSSAIFWGVKLLFWTFIHNMHLVCPFITV